MASMSCTSARRGRSPAWSPRYAPRVHDVPRAVLRRLRPHRPGPGLDRAGCPLPQLPTTPDRPALPHLQAVIKPVAGRTSDGQPLCARCAPRPRRRCGRCDRVRVIARRAHDGQPDICDACFRGPEATCSVCARRRPCNFATTSAPVCTGCASRPLRSCARCHTPQPVTAVWPEGPVCDRCYTTALRTRATCHSCGQQRRLVVPHGPDATTCSDCAGLPAVHTCSDCGIEDKLYERGRCDRCALRRRVTDLLATS
jgi:hypothetical protein